MSTSVFKQCTMNIFGCLFVNKTGPKNIKPCSLLEQYFTTESVIHTKEKTFRDKIAVVQCKF